MSHYLDIADDLLRRIAAGEFTSAGKLPSRASLAVHYGVTGHVIKQARDTLAAQGVVDIGGRITGPNGVVVNDPHAFALEQLSVARAALERATSTLAAMGVTEQPPASLG